MTAAYTELTIGGRELDIEFTDHHQGFRMFVTEWDGAAWVDLPGFDGLLYILQTRFEALCGLSNELFDEAVHAETMAEALGIPIVWHDDEQAED
jgi:hypothetical protein